MRDLTVKPKTRKLLEENTGKKKLCDVGLGKYFLDITREAQSIKKKIYKFDFITIKSFCSLRDTVKRMENQVTYLKTPYILEYIKNPQLNNIRYKPIFKNGQKI